MRTHRGRRAAVGALAALAACGGGSSPTSPTPSPTPTAPTFTIDAGGVITPKELVVAPGTRVLFTNRSARARQMSSDPHPEHTDCPEINQVGFLPPNATRETGNLNTTRTCGFHDHEAPNDGNVRGRIVIR